jgi:hypothetical protein
VAGSPRDVRQGAVALGAHSPTVPRLFSPIPCCRVERRTVVLDGTRPKRHPSTEIMRVHSSARWTTSIVVACCCVLIAWTQPRVAAIAEGVKQRADVYALPPAALMPAVSFGFRSALADLIWADVLVTQGLRMAERRPFDHLEKYLDAVNELDPKFREPYRLADSLLAFQSGDQRAEANVRAARRIAERGLKEFPNDAQLWINYGEFVAYLAPSFLKKEDDQKQWRIDGARALIHAGDLGGGAGKFNLWHSVSGIGILTRAGEQDAILRFLERVYAMTEDEELRDYVQARILALTQGKQSSRAIDVARAFDALWRRQMPFVSRTTFRVLGPPVPTWRCAGRTDPDDTLCARSWPAWTQSVAAPIQ